MSRPLLPVYYNRLLPLRLDEEGQGSRMMGWSGNGEAGEGAELEGMHPELVLRALQLLEQQDKAKYESLMILTQFPLLFLPPSILFFYALFRRFDPPLSGGQECAEFAGFFGTFLIPILQPALLSSLACNVINRGCPLVC